MKIKLILSFFLIVYSGLALAEDAKKETPKPAAETPKAEILLTRSKLMATQSATKQ